MIQIGSTVILRTENAFYSPCKIVRLGTDNITISYYPEIKNDNKTGKIIASSKQETISRKKIISMCERI